MKIGQPLLKAIKAVILMHNQNENGRVASALKVRDEHARKKAKIGNLLAARRKFQLQTDAFDAKVRAVDSELYERGFHHDGTVRDASVLGLAPMESRKLNEDVIIAELARATPEQGKKILARIGIKF